MKMKANRVDVAPGTIVVYSDIGCPWAHIAVARLLAARHRLGVDDRLVLDHRPFPLELVNERPTPYPILTAELPVAGGVEPAAGWQVWQRPLSEWPVTTLPALEAVQAAKAQGLDVSERLDRALRLAFFAQSRCISLRSVITDVAGSVAGLDVEELDRALDRGQSRSALHEARPEVVKGSPHLFLPDGSDVHNPGIELHWEGEHGRGFPVVDKDTPLVYDDLVRAAATGR
jgi:predicted DsbA family dithiol-disulfide isomerase